MNEVEKMYKTILGEFASNCSLCAKLIDCEIINNTHNCNKFECDYKRLFTAEKQLELIKWLAIGGEVCRIDATEKGKWFVENDYKTSKCFVEFTEALANVINDLWQDLTDVERTQIKEILK